MCNISLDAFTLKMSFHANQISFSLSQGFMDRWLSRREEQPIKICDFDTPNISLSSVNLSLRTGWAKEEQCLSSWERDSISTLIMRGSPAGILQMEWFVIDLVH